MGHILFSGSESSAPVSGTAYRRNHGFLSLHSPLLSLGSCHEPCWRGRGGVLRWLDLQSNSSVEPQAPLSLLCYWVKGRGGRLIPNLSGSHFPSLTTHTSLAVCCTHSLLVSLFASLTIHSSVYSLRPPCSRISLTCPLILLFPQPPLEPPVCKLALLPTGIAPLRSTVAPWGPSRVPLKSSYNGPWSVSVMPIAASFFLSLFTIVVRTLNVGWSPLTNI